MSVNWKMSEKAWGVEPLAEDFDECGCGDGHRVFIGDEIEATDRQGCHHCGIVVGIIRDINGVPVCYKLWNDEEYFDYVQAVDVTICEPCGSSEWSLTRIGYKRYDGVSECGLYRNEQTGDVIYW